MRVECQGLRALNQSPAFGGGTPQADATGQPSTILRRLPGVWEGDGITNVCKRSASGSTILRMFCISSLYCY